MIDLPDSWRVENNGKRLNLKSLTPPTLPTAQRARLRKVLRKAILTHQLTGPEIPSLITDEYHCQAILFLDIELTDLKQAEFAARAIQPQIKEHAVIRFHTGGDINAFSFAHKRLSLNDDNAIVISDAYCTSMQNGMMALAPLRQPSLLNRINKLDHYLESMTKAFLIDHPKIFLGATRLLDTKLWHHGPSIIALFRALNEVKSLKTQKDRAKSLTEKAALNTALKSAIDRLKRDFPTTPKKP